MRKFFTRITIFLLIVIATIATTLAVVFYIQQRNTMSQLATAAADLDKAKQDNTDLQNKLNEFNSMPTALIGSCYHQSTDGWIVVNLPCEDSALSATFTVRGVAFGTFEGVVSYEILDANQKLVVQGALQVNATEAGLPANFTSILSWDNTKATTEKGTIRFYLASAKDGSKTHIVEIPVKLK